MRKLAWLAIAGISPLLGLGCMPAPSLTRLTPLLPRASFQGVQVALVEFAPLPKTYPVGAKPYFPTLTGELYEEERVILRPGPAMTRIEAQTSFVKEKVTVRTFIPRDHLTILTETVLLAMKEKGIAVQVSPTLSAARQQDPALIVTGVVNEFRAGQASDNSDFSAESGNITSGQADIRVSVIIFSRDAGTRLWEGELHSTVVHTEIITNALHANWIDALEITGVSLHPFRALLALASYNLAAQLVERLEETANLPRAHVR